MPVDPLLNCAAEVCCGPRPPVAGATTSYNQPAHEARVKILVGLGIPMELAPKVSKEMVSKGLVFLSAQLAFAIREIVFPEKT
jgi:hypothetical protein